jgi:hypothetical protein
VAGTDIDEGLLRAAVEAVRPFVRRLLAAGVPFGRLESRLRELFVRVAEAEGARPGRRQTDSRIALLTGINRKEVRRIRSAEADAPAPASFSRNLAASVASRWRTDPRCSDREGRPIPLPYRAARGPSFVRLARATTRDLPPRALLDALVEAGAAEARADGTVRLASDAYVPRRGRAEHLAMLAEDPGELIETMLHNVLAEGDDRRLQRKVAYDNLGADGIRRVRAELRREGERFLRRIDRLLARRDRDRNPRAAGGERRYAGLGLYYFEAPERPGGAARSGRSRTGRKP